MPVADPEHGTASDGHVASGENNNTNVNASEMPSSPPPTGEPFRRPTADHLRRPIGRNKSLRQTFRKLGSFITR